MNSLLQPGLDGTRVVHLGKEPAVFVETVLTGMGERSVIRQLSPRLRGEGKAIGVHAHKSGGIPWRNLPDYSKGATDAVGSNAGAGLLSP